MQIIFFHYKITIFYYFFYKTLNGNKSDLKKKTHAVFFVLWSLLHIEHEEKISEFYLLGISR